GNGQNGVVIFPEYRVVHSVGSYSATASNNNAKPAKWAAAIVTYKLAVPTVSSIVRASTTPTNAASVDFTANFSSPVFGVDASDFALATTGVSGASITTVTGSGSSRTVTVNTGTGTGTVGLN